MNPPLLIVGASVRAAAESAHAAGYQVKAIDLFSDQDLKEIADCRLSIQYPEDLHRLASEFANIPYLYTGALENYPEVLAKLSANHPLLGTGSDSMEKIRDPFWLRDFLQSASLPTIDLKTHDAPPDNAEKWLIKPFRSGHGLQIRNGLGAPAQHDEYYQELKRGLSVGAMFLADGQHCQLIGCHQQLRALQLDSSQPYQFCGAVAPLPLPDDTVNTISNIGELLTQETSLRGLFGCDFIVSENTPYLLEVNPRYTAATELWETLLNRSLIADHITACQQGLLSTIPTYHFSGISLKLILYAPEETVVTNHFHECLNQVEGTRIADLPAPGNTIAQHDPVCTLLLMGAKRQDISKAAFQSLTAIAGNLEWNPQLASTLSREISSQIAENIA